MLDQTLGEISAAQPPKPDLFRWPDEGVWRLARWAERAGSVVRKMISAALPFEIAQVRAWRKRAAQATRERADREAEAKACRYNPPAAHGHE